MVFIIFPLTDNTKRTANTGLRDSRLCNVEIWLKNLIERLPQAAKRCENGKRPAIIRRKWSHLTISEPIMGRYLGFQT